MEKEQAYDEDSGSSGERSFDPKLLEDIQCDMHFLDDAETHLEPFFDVESVQPMNANECYLC